LFTNFFSKVKELSIEHYKMDSSIEIHTSNKNKIGLVLSGGGSKGAYQVGMVKCLAEIGIPIHAVAGASVGALNGALLCCYDDLSIAAKRLQEIWMKMAEEPPPEIKIAKVFPSLSLGLYLTLMFAIDYRSALISIIGDLGRGESGEIIHTLDAIAKLSQQSKRRRNSLADLIEQYIDLTSLDRGREFYVSVLKSRGAIKDISAALMSTLRLCNVENSDFLHVNKLDHTNRKAAVVASAALPIIFEATSVGGSEFIDGGFGGWQSRQGNTPATPLINDAKCNIIIVNHLEDSSPWNRFSFPDTVCIEVRPNSPIARKGGITDSMSFDKENIQSWINQGYTDTYLCLGDIHSKLKAVQSGDQAREHRSRAIDRLFTSE
jgi:NTE family protein